MAKDPAFLFYSSDFLTGVSDLTMEERGQYITLLCLQHQKGHLSKKMITIAVANATDDVMMKFKQDEEGLYFNERLEVEAGKRAEHSRKQKERAIKGWEKRKSHSNATADATALPLENEDVNEDIIRNINPEEKKPSGKKEMSLQEKTVWLVNKFNKITGKNCKPLQKVKEQLGARLKEGFTGANILKATKNAYNSEYHQENPDYLTPTFITRADKLDMWLNAKQTQNGATKKKFEIPEQKETQVRL